ncbi:Conserved_hypothetical protein [Hexamita inflata]|uniref:Uncharacterized protein n=1 Tax=Hexamita inflata TaxID=28002 RepID=A0AA86THU2_9EUKA|nr:Conserved hypothetical protein [Hexamita inflata]
MNELLHKNKLYPEIDLYLCTNNDNIELIYHDQIYKITIQHQYTNEQRYKEILYTKLYSISICKCKLYVSYHENIYEYNQKGLQQLCKIPIIQFTDSYSLYSRMFSFNDELYVHDNQKSLFILHNNKMKLVKECRGHFFQFCNNIIVFDQNQQEISFLRNDLSYSLLCKTEDAEYISIAQGGLFVVHSSNCDKVYVVDMINKRVVVNSDISLKHKYGPSPSIFQHLVQGSSGIQLCDQKLIELFGDQFPEQISNTFSEYVYSFGEQYRQNLCQILSNAKIIIPKQLQTQSVLTKLQSPDIGSLKFWQLRHLICLKPNVYFVFEDNCLYFIQSDLKILRAFVQRNEWDKYGSIASKSYSGNLIEMQQYSKMQGCTSHLYSSILCNGYIYFLLAYTKIVRVDPISLKIAEFSRLYLWDSQQTFDTQDYARIFTLNGTIYIHSDSSIYKIVGQDREDMLFVKRKFGQFYQFCDNVFVFNIFNQQISKLDSELNFNLVAQTKDAYWVSFAHGLLVVHTEKCEHVWVVNMSNSKVRIFKNGAPLHYNRIQDQITIGRFGLQLKMFEKENEELNSYYQKFINQQKQQYSEFKTLVDNLSFDYLQQNRIQSVKENIQTMNKNIEIITKMVANKQQSVTDNITKLSELISTLCLKFEQIASSADQ